MKELKHLNKYFFKLASEIIARTYENGKSCEHQLSDNELVEKFIETNNQTGLMSALRGAKITQNLHLQGFKNIILILDPSTREVKMQHYDSFTEAAKKYHSLEESNKNKDIVLVRSDSLKSIKNAFKNYFTDTEDFIDIISKGIEKLKPRTIL